MKYPYYYAGLQCAFLPFEYTIYWSVWFSYSTLSISLRNYLLAFKLTVVLPRGEGFCLIFIMFCSFGSKNYNFLESLRFTIDLQGYGVVLVNTDEAGTLFVTNFRLLFLVSKALYLYLKSFFCMIFIYSDLIWLRVQKGLDGRQSMLQFIFVMLKNVNMSN